MNETGRELFPGRFSRADERCLLERISMLSRAARVLLVSLAFTITLMALIYSDVSLARRKDRVTHDVPGTFPVLLVCKSAPADSTVARIVYYRDLADETRSSNASYLVPLGLDAKLNAQIAVKRKLFEVKRLTTKKQYITVINRDSRGTGSEIGWYIASSNSITPKYYQEKSNPRLVAILDLPFTLLANVILWLIGSRVYRWRTGKTVLPPHLWLPRIW